MPRSKGRATRAKRGRRNPPNPWLVLQRSGIHGRGVYARKDIPKGTRLIEYTGELISNAEADRRYEDEKMSRHHTFLFILNSRSCVDAAVGGNIARFINHQCDPNCVAWIEGKHIWIDALRDIKQGEELGYEYEYDFDPEYTIEDLEFYGCKCGSPKCRGTIVDIPKRKSHLIRELRRRMRKREGAGKRRTATRRARRRA
jgi:SET domain-containing protein